MWLQYIQLARRLEVSLRQVLDIRLIVLVVLLADGRSLNGSWPSGTVAVCLVQSLRVDRSSCAAKHSTSTPSNESGTASLCSALVYQRASKMKVLCYFLVVFRIAESFSWTVRVRGTPVAKQWGRVSLQSSYDDFKLPEQQNLIENNENEDQPSDEELEALLGDWDDRVARLNTVHLVGRVGNTPEPRYFDDGKVVVNLSLACRRKYHYSERKALDIKSGDEETDWYGLEIWGQTAEFVSKFVDKGARVGVIGALQIDEWNDKETGEKRNKAKVVVREFDVLESKAEADLRRQNSRGPSFYTDDDDEYKPSSGSAGGFFD
eukprot:scaffold721_cov131-Cylindrotheca_fusiformis.AAC.76